MPITRASDLDHITMSVGGSFSHGFVVTDYTALYSIDNCAKQYRFDQRDERLHLDKFQITG